jgi:A/G-specific adenine glycosylase
MLQQTQVAAVIPYYARFLARFPDVQALARASQDEVLTLWAGLGYYARGRNLHAAAKTIAQHGFPQEAHDIAQLPGVGRSTAAAIAAFAFGERAAILDGNVKRVLARCFAVQEKTRLWTLAERLLPRKGIEAYTQGIMDLGATVCLRAKPRCDACPVAGECIARKKNLVESFPAPRPRKALPHKEVTWLVLRHADEVLLEKRPAPGIWGGLWCFPEVSNEQEGRRLEPLEHGFTHFRLRIHPLLREVPKKPAQAESPGRVWIELSHAAHAAVPTPVRKLVARLVG